MARPPTRPSAVDRIAGWIATGRYAPGDSLPTEPDLGGALAVSRTVVREAIKTLAAKGMVVVGPRVGTRVRPRGDWNQFDPDVVRWRLSAGVDDAFVRDLIELRSAVEPAAARLAARAATAADIAAARAALQNMTDAANGDGDYVAADLDFHMRLLDATHNQFVAGMIPAFSALLAASFGLSVRSMAGARASLPAHRRVLDAIVARAPTRAEAAMAALIARTGAELGVRSEGRRALGRAAA